MTRTAALAAFAIACAPHGSLGRDLPNGTTEDTATSIASTSTSTSDGHTTTGTATTELDSGSDSGGSTTHGSTDDGSSTAAVDVCAPDVDDDACLACRKAQCCEVWAACLADEVCVCIETCIADGGDPATCESTHCAGPNVNWTHVHDCSAASCAADCPG